MYLKAKFFDALTDCHRPYYLNSQRRKHQLRPMKLEPVPKAMKMTMRTLSTKRSLPLSLKPILPGKPVMKKRSKG